jgi:hypothetical protein
MRQLEYLPCLADPDLLMKRMKQPDDGFGYYAYVLLYVDYTFSLSHDAEDTLREIDKSFPIKDSSVGDPDIYLWSKLRKLQLSTGV